jgi:hypothetical protein
LGERLVYMSNSCRRYNLLVLRVKVLQFLKYGTPILLSLLLLSVSMILVTDFPVVSASPTDFVDGVQVGFYLRYHEEIYVSWEERGWFGTKVGEAVRRITISDVGKEDFTIREDITYSMIVPSDLDYFYVDLETLDGNREELAGGARDILYGDIVNSSIHAYYSVDMKTGNVLEFIMGGVENDGEADLRSEMPLEFEHYWSYLNFSENTQEYCWDVVGFPIEDSNWGYSVEPNMEKGKSFDNNKWTVKDPITYQFDGQTQDCMNVTGKWKDESDGTVLGEWESGKTCDRDTGLKLTQSWSGDCQVQVYDMGSLEWSLKDGFKLTVSQVLTDTNFRLQARESPLSTVRILSPNQGAFLGDTIKVRTQVYNKLHDTSITQVSYYTKSSTSEKWTFLESHGIVGETPNLWFDDLDVNVISWTGKWQIKAVGKSYSGSEVSGEYFDIVDVFLKPVYIDKLDIRLLNQAKFGPHTDGGLDRIPYDVSFNLVARENTIGDLNILIDCWYLPLTGSYFSEETGETIRLEDYWGGDPQYQALFKAMYAGESDETDPIIGSYALTSKSITGEPPYLVDGGNYNSKDYSYTILNREGGAYEGSVGSNQATGLSLKKGEIASFSFGLFFQNPGSASSPKIRLYSFEVLIDYEINNEGEKQSFTERAQKNIAVRYTDPVLTPFDAFVEGISQAFLINNMIGYKIEESFGKEYAQAAYQGNYVRYLYYLAMGLDMTIKNAPTALSYFGILTGPYWAAVVGTVSLATGVPLPTSWLDLFNEISARYYASVPQEERVGVWYILLQAAAGVEETYVFDPEPIVTWANVVRVSGDGDLLNTTVRLNVNTYEKADNMYYLDFNLTNVGSYPARFLKVYIEGEQPNAWTKHEFPQNKTYIEVDPNGVYGGTDIYVGSEHGKYRIDVYFISEPSSNTPPIFSTESVNNICTGSEEFDVLVISQAVTAFSPVDIHVYDQNNNHVGSTVSGDVENEISGSWYSGSESHPEVVILSDDSITAKVEVVGTESGSFRLSFLKSMTVTDSRGGESVEMASFVLPARTISEGEKIFYDYDFGLLEKEINELTEQGWSFNEAVMYVFSKMDGDDGLPDITDGDIIEGDGSFDLTTIGIILAIIVVIIVGIFFLRSKRTRKPKYKKLDQF